jgi:hypothetical protein
MSERFFALALIAMPIALGFLLNRRFAIRLQNYLGLLRYNLRKRLSRSA